MTQPPYPPPGGPAGSQQGPDTDWVALPPDLPPHVPSAAPTGWSAPPSPPAWSTPAPRPAWSTPAATPVAPPAARPVRRQWVIPAAVGITGVLAGAVAGMVVVSSAFLSSAEAMGREMGRGMAEELGRSFLEGITPGLESGAVPGGPGSFGPVEQGDPVPPGDLGPDPVLDQYAQACFEGTLQACDDLYYESPPLSEYEQYALSCGGRVKVYSVLACTELD